MCTHPPISVMVAGLTPSGVAAALALKACGLDVWVVDPKAGSLDDLYEIQPTPLNSLLMSAPEWAQAAEKTLVEKGIPFDYHWFPPLNFETCAETGRVRWHEIGDEKTVTADAIVFEATGHQGRPLTDEEERFMGKGLSWSAFDDRPSCIRKRVGVRGCSRMAIFQALIAAKVAASVKILCPDPEVEALAGYLERLRQGGVHVHTQTAITRLLGNGGGRLQAIEVRNGDYTTRLEMDILFPTADPTVNWTDNTLPEPWNEVGDRLFVAGVGAGIPYWDHTAEWADGVRAAQEVLKRFP